MNRNARRRRRWLMQSAKKQDLLIALASNSPSQKILHTVEAARLIGMSVHCEFDTMQGEDAQSAEERQIQIGRALLRALSK